jgi:O-antigen ligase
MAVIRKPVLAVAVALALLLLGGAMFYLYPQFFLNRGSSYRFDIWLESWNMIQQAPWFGIGLGARPPVLAQGFEHAHNLYLYQWLTTGLVGLVLFAVLVLVAIQGAVSRSKRRSLPYILAMIYFLAAMLTDVQYLISSPNEAWLCFWFCLVFLLSLEKKDNVGHKPLG